VKGTGTCVLHPLLSVVLCRIIPAAPPPFLFGIAAASAAASVPTLPAKLHQEIIRYFTFSLARLGKRRLQSYEIKTYRRTVSQTGIRIMNAIDIVYAPARLYANPYSTFYSVADPDPPVIHGQKVKFKTKFPTK
jgi:hypothetical protein